MADEDILDATKLNETDGLIGDGDDGNITLDSTSKPPKQRIIDGDKYESVPIASTSRRGSTEDSGGVDAPIKVLQDSMYEADKRIIEKFAQFNPTKYKVIAKMDTYGRVIMEMNGRKNSRQYTILNRDGSSGVLLKDLPKEFRKALGRPAKELLKDNEAEDRRLQDERKQLDKRDRQYQIDSRNEHERFRRIEEGLRNANEN